MCRNSEIKVGADTERMMCFIWTGGKLNLCQNFSLSKLYFKRRGSLWGDKVKKRAHAALMAT